MLMKDGGRAWAPPDPLRAVWPQLESSRSWSTTIMSQSACRWSHEPATRSIETRGQRFAYEIMAGVGFGLRESESL